MIQHFLILAGAGALGSVLRYWVMLSFPARDFPWPVMTVNVVGSILMGLAYFLLVEKQWLPDAYRVYLMTGFLGAFTTFSAFSLDVFLLLEKGQAVYALGYVFGSVLMCIGCLYLTLWLCRALF